ncbi:MAG: hypothetical protein ACI86S_002183 [Paracoccaceae bacterium]|jgi:hypothetical protein
MLEPVLQFATIVGMFHTFDSIVLDRHKALVSGYIFGNGEIRLGAFERGLMQALISPFLIDGRLVWRRVAVLSIVVSFAANLYINVLAESASPISVKANLKYALIVAPIAALLSWPFDWLSLRISKFLFLDRAFAVYLLAPLIALDIVLSVLPSFGEINLLVILAPEPVFGSFSHKYLIPAILGAIVANTIASLLITFMQILTIVVGLLTRVGVMLLRLAPVVARNTKFSNYPFTFVGVVAAISFQAISLIA